MSDGQLDIEFKFNTQQAKKDAEEVQQAAKKVNEEAKNGNAPLKEREGIVERLKRRMAELGQQQDKAMSVASVARINRELQMHGNELTRVTRAGKQGFDQYGAAMVSNEGILQRLQRAAALYQKGMYEATRPDNLEKYSQKLALINTEMSKLTKGQNIGGSGWNGLQNSINQISRELPAFTYSVQTGFMAISNNIPIFIDEINRLKAANAALNAEGKKGIPIWKQVASSLFSWQTAMSIGITLMTVYGKEIGEWVVALFKGKNALEELKKAQEAFVATRLKGAQDARRELTSLEALYRATQNTALSVTERKKAVDALQSQYPSYFKNLTDEQVMAGKAAGAYDKLKNSIIGAARARAYQDKIAELASKKLENEDKIIESASETMRLESNYKSAQNSLNLMSPGSNAYSAQVNRANSVTNEIETKKQLINTLNKANAEIDKEMNRYDRAIDNTVQQNGIEVLTGVGGKDAAQQVKDVSKLYDQILNGRRDMQNKIADLDKEYARKAMETDEAELQALKDKFSKFRRIIEEENAKINKYNLINKDKKGFKAVDLIDVSQLNGIEGRATEDLKYTQQTKALSIEIEKQKQIFADYENYRAKLGKEKADERFKADLKGFETYKQYIDSVAKSEATAIDAVSNKTATAGQEGRAKLITKEDEAAKREEERKYTDLLALMITYDQKRKILIAAFEAERSKIVASATVEELREFDRKHVEQLNALDDSNIQQLASYKSLFEGIQDLSDAAARKVIADARVMLANNRNMSADERKKIEKTLKTTEQTLSDRLPDRVLKLSDAFSEMAQEIGKVNDGLGGMLNGVSTVLRSVAQIDKGIDSLTKGIDNYSKNKQDGGGGILGTISAVAGIAGPAGQIVSAVSSVVSGVIGMAKRNKEMNRQARESIKQFYDAAKRGEEEYQSLLRQRELRDASRGKNSYNAIIAQLEAIKKQAPEVEKAYNKVFDALQGESSVEGQGYKHGTWVRKAKTWDILATLQGSDYARLEQLYTEGRLKDKAKADFEALKALKAELESLGLSLEDLEKDLKQLLTGTDISGLASGLSDLLANGKRYATDFGKSFTSILQNAIKASFEAKYLQDAMTPFYNELADLMESGNLNESQIDQLKAKYIALGETYAKQWEQIEKVTGVDLSGKDDSSIQGRINRSATEDTASEILGFERARYDLAKLTYAAAQKEIEFVTKSYDVMLDQLKVQKAIEQNTADTTAELKNAVAELKEINSNTSIKVGR